MRYSPGLAKPDGNAHTKSMPTDRSSRLSHAAARQAAKNWPQRLTRIHPTAGRAAESAAGNGRVATSNNESETQNGDNSHEQGDISNEG